MKAALLSSIQFVKSMTLVKFMRITHKYLGFLTIGFTALYGLTGLLLMQGNQTAFLRNALKVERHQIQSLNANLEGNALKEVLATQFKRKIKTIKLETTTGDLIAFTIGNNPGTYHTQTGEASLVTRGYYPFVKKMLAFHKSPGEPKAQYVAIAYCVMLLYLAISSLFLYKFNSTLFIKGIVSSVIGIILFIVIIEYL